jgi:Rrf2 family protein
MLTAKGKYALKALIYLSSLEPGEKAQGLAISKAGNIPKKFLDAILGELRNAGVVFTKKGPGGGYMIDGPLAPIGCASRSAYEPCADCKSVKACAVRFTMVKVRDAISDVLDRMTIADMVAMSEGGNVTPMVTGRSAASGRKRR